MTIRVIGLSAALVSRVRHVSAWHLYKVVEGLRLWCRKSPARLVLAEILRASEVSHSRPPLIALNQVGMLVAHLGELG
jgi:hypothetical protein